MGLFSNERKQILWISDATTEKSATRLHRQITSSDSVVNDTHNHTNTQALKTDSSLVPTTKPRRKHRWFFTNAAAHNRPMGGCQPQYDSRVHFVFAFGR